MGTPIHSQGAEIKKTVACKAALTRPDAHAQELFESILGKGPASAHLTQAFEEARQNALKARSSELKKKDLYRVNHPDWVNELVKYMGYANSTGTTNGTGSFDSLTTLQPYFDKLGVNMVYALPFLTSPFGDAGFDVADYRQVDQRFGGDKAFARFNHERQERGGSLQMDLILNHISSEHPWSKKALAGDTKFRAYFHILESPPRVISVHKNSAGQPESAIYLEKDPTGKDRTVERRVIFPQFADPEHPHYTELKDSRGKKIWVYHTFYPFQWDLNYNNPETLAEALTIVSFWANRGADVLRLDAVPFLFKDRESDPRTMKVVEVLRYFLSQVAPATVIIGEACQEPKVVYSYFGQATTLSVPQLETKMQTSSGVQLLYNFDLMVKIWGSLFSKDSKFIAQALRDTPEPPLGAAWANFLRLHDELTLEMAPEELRKIVQHELLDTGKGVPFRGNLGIAGRMANFLDRNPARIQQAFAILFSLKGVPIVYYGDEIMAGNNMAYAESAAKARGDQFDSRDVGRGPVEMSAYMKALKDGATSPEGTVLQSVQRMTTVRRQRDSILHGSTHVLESGNSHVLAYTRSSNKESTLIVHNLDSQSQQLRLKDLPAKAQDLLSGKTVEAQGGVLELQPYESLWLPL